MDGFTEGATAPAAGVAAAPPAAAVVPDKKSIDGFWGIKFGTSEAQAKAIVAGKGGKLDSEDSKSDVLFFDKVVFTDRSTKFLQLNFITDKLYQAVVVFPAPEDAQLIVTFNTIIHELKDVYGDPKIEKSYQQPYYDGDGFEVLALKSGKANYAARWQTNNGTKIQLQINSNGELSLFYTDTILEKSKTAQKSGDY